MRIELSDGADVAALADLGQLLEVASLQLVLVDRVLSPHALQWLFLHRFNDLLDNLWQVLVADRVVVARLLLNRQQICG